MGLELPVWDAWTIGLIVATLGLVGASVLDRFLDDGTNDDGGMDGDDDVFGGGMGGGDGGMGGSMGDGDGFDDFDGMDEWDDGFDDTDESGSDTDELANRLDDLEAEVATLSSTVSTVRSENEEISEAVDDIEEDVRNLLDIYEMVTRGINPFVDDTTGFEGTGGGESSFGLFDDDTEEPDEALDDDLASADADGFFDEELVEPDDGGFDDVGLAEDEQDDEGDAGGAADAASEAESADDGDDMNDDAKSFSELKEEYDAGEADWADEAGSETATDEASGVLDGFEDDTDSVEDPNASHDDTTDVPGVGEGSGGENHGDEGRRDHAVSDRGRAPGGDPADAIDDGFEYIGADDLSGSGRKPYLTDLPADYVGDLLVMEWLEFLVSESDVTDAVRAIHYYERIEWVGPEAGARLRDFLSGFGRIDRNLIDRPGTDELVREHHTRSLRYITQLNGTSSHTVLLDRWDDLAGGSLLGGSPPAPARENHRGQGRSRNRRSNGASRETVDERRGGEAPNRPDGGSSRPTSESPSRPEHGDVAHREHGDVAHPEHSDAPHPEHDGSAEGGWGDGR